MFAGILFGTLLMVTAPSPLHAGGFVPGWVKDAVFYQIFPERFANGDTTTALTTLPVVATTVGSIPQFVGAAAELVAVPERPAIG